MRPGPDPCMHGSVREAALRDVDRELDAVAVDEEGAVIAVGSCRWTTGELPYGEKAKLEALGRHLAPEARTPPDLYFFAREGFAAGLAADAKTDPRIHLVTVEQLVGPPTGRASS